MLASCVRTSLLVAVALLALCASPSSAQTTVYFTASSAAGVYPATCTTGSLSCSSNATSGGYACTGGTVSGTHYYYPSATAPTFVSSLVVGQPPILCEQYYADSQLPLTAGGLNVQYGSGSTAVCVNYRVRNGVFTADPDAVDANNIAFNYSTTAASVPACPAVVASTGSGSATVYFTYTATNGTVAGAATTVCASGSLSCTSLGGAYYMCPTLNSGTHYQYSAASNSFQTISLSGEIECNGFGDGYLPLDYEGISFGGSFGSAYQCISWYGGSSGAGFDFYNTNSINNYTGYSKGTQSFTYSTTSTSAQAACSSIIPGLTSSAWATASVSLSALLLASALTAIAMIV